MKKVFLVLSVLLLVLSSCATGTGESIPKAAVPAYRDLGWLQSIKSTIYVTLDGNATTGYGWVVEIEGESVELRSEEYTAPEDTGLLGAGGVWKAEFKAAADGVSTITFKYVRPWGDGEMASMKKVAVTVESGVITAISEI